MAQKIQVNGNIHIPKRIQEQLPSNEFEMSVVEMNGVKCLVATPVNPTKKPVIKYE